MYLNYQGMSLEYDLKRHAFEVFFTPENTRAPQSFLKAAVGPARGPVGDPFKPNDYHEVATQITALMNGQSLALQFRKGPTEAPDLDLKFTIKNHVLEIETFIRGFVEISGLFAWGLNPRENTFGVGQGRETLLRSAIGPAFTAHDQALFDRQSDRLLEFQAPESFDVFFDWKADAYGFTFTNGLDYGRHFAFQIREGVLKKKLAIPYAPIQKSHGFTTPPVGWMTWYALKFDTHADLVLENAKAFSVLLGPFSKDLCIWVDWEWNHSAFDGLGEAGVDTFHPRPGAYPAGLADVAQKIKALGLTPALWIGATNDGRKNEMLAEHPEWLLGQKPTWCGQWWVDPSHPGVLKEYIPRVFRQVLDWGYEAIKWDCLPASFAACDHFHHAFHDKSKSTDAAMRDAVSAARDTIGPHVYLLSCSGETHRDIGFAPDLFSAARIGGDVFGWEEYLRNALARVYHFYPWHNTALYIDADNLVLRPEFNTLAQARSRLSLYALAGLPLTLGDALTDLDEPRRHMLRRAVPVCDTHPMELSGKTPGDQTARLCLTVNKPFGQWQVVSLTNLESNTAEINLSLSADLGVSLPSGAPVALFDFWNEKFLGLFGDRFQTTIGPTDTQVLRVTPVGPHPTLISTSRHLTQGGVDLKDLRWDGPSLALIGLSVCVNGDAYRISVYVPDTFAFKNFSGSQPGNVEISGNLLTLTVHPAQSGPVNWNLSFSSLPFKVTN